MTVGVFSFVPSAILPTRMTIEVKVPYSFLLLRVLQNNRLTSQVLIPNKFEEGQHICKPFEPPTLHQLTKFVPETVGFRVL
jgi:hypothetical protein